MKTHSPEHPDRVQQSLSAQRRSNARPTKRLVPQSKAGFPSISWEDVLGRR
ncbi:hypothetical protein [Synechococcus sp. CC9616]|uniref:hypothetical protein n=1 Tax=Synechococcus sp. CC9616 TaxID=110663 RepID=UPI0012EC474F|nr:hypothetical protein [Synechococcus sp. CC9616]